MISSIDPATFRAKYNVPPAVQVVGPWLGILQLDGESIALERPDTPQAVLSGTIIPYIVVDAVKFTNVAPWPTPPDGTGPSLLRIEPYAYGNDPINWTVSLAGGSPGTITPNLPPAPLTPSARRPARMRVVVGIGLGIAEVPLFGSVHGSYPLCRPSARPHQVSTTFTSGLRTLTWTIS